MARYCDSVCRQCRREGMKLFLKGDRCYSERCAFERRQYPPGQHGQGRGKFSDYGLQLREKQKVKRMYGVLERQFRRYFRNADKGKGITGENLLFMLERRLDNATFRMGFANTRAEARQLVRHGHFAVNGHKVDLPSYQLKVGDVVEVREKSRKIVRIQEAIKTVARRGIPSWVEVDEKSWKGVVRALPLREELTIPIQEQLIVELYSK
ncbi:MAG: 30S ribosomal protein S4 [Deltaproteobacteria bacterium]|nr:30S ribosomal protein S4 [Deltaproteobacteria bacterium]